MSTTQRHADVGIRPDKDTFLVQENPFEEMMSKMNRLMDAIERVLDGLP